MKTVDEIAKNVFEQRDRYDLMMRRKKKVLRSVLIPTGSVAAAALLVFVPLSIVNTRSNLKSSESVYSAPMKNQDALSEEMNYAAKNEMEYDEMEECADDACFDEEVVMEEEEEMVEDMTREETMAVTSSDYAFSVSDIRMENNIVFLKLTNTSSEEATFSCKEIYFMCEKEADGVSIMNTVHPNEDASDCGTVTLLPGEEMDYGFSLENFTFSEEGDYKLCIPSGVTDFIYSVDEL